MYKNFGKNLDVCFLPHDAMQERILPKFLYITYVRGSVLLWRQGN